MRLSVIIPAWNEEQRIATTLKDVTTHLNKQKYDYEILVVDDGSTDKTASVVSSLRLPRVRVLRHKRNQGKGSAVRTGMLAASGDLLLFTDADHSTPIQELDKFLTYTDKYDIVIASRSIKGAELEVKQPWYRMLIGKIFNKVVRLFTVRGIIDTQCGFKLFTRKAAHDIFPRQTIKRWGFDVEVLFLARKFGYSIIELPVRWRNRSESRVDPVWDSLRMLKEILQIRWNDLRGRYVRGRYA